MKKTIGTLVLVLALFVFIGCNGNSTLTTEQPTEAGTTETNTTEVATTEEPTTGEPTTNAQTTTETPTTEIPTTEVPTTEEPFASELFFSEYGEGSSYNKYIEIFNGTGNRIDLSDYSIQLYSNGAASPSQSLTLTGFLDNYDVFVVANPTADASILEQADIENSQVINFNGNDPVTLLKNV